MKRPSKEEQRELIRTWKQTGEMLDKLRMEKLRDKPYDWKEVDALLSLAQYYKGPPRLTSGLEEQQRLFMKAAPEWYKKLRGIE